MSPLTLWSDSACTRYFLIPEEQELFEGEFSIHTITGRKLTVDPAALTSCEISKNEAKRYLESEFGKMLDSARGAVDAFINRLHGADDNPLKAVSNAVETLENALRRYTFSKKIETEADIHALQDHADRILEIAERLRSLASR